MTRQTVLFFALLIGSLLMLRFAWHPLSDHLATSARGEIIIRGVWCHSDGLRQWCDPDLAVGDVVR